ncbi:MAG: hypothetical protein AAGC92_15920 [Pseudomonadota bacterium]
MRTQQVLDQSSRALEAGDFVLYRRGKDIPCVLIHDTHTEVLDTEAAARRNFDKLAGLLAAKPGQTLVRTVLHEQAIGGALIQSLVRSHVECNGEAIIDPFQSFITYRLVGSNWRAMMVVCPVSSRWASYASLPGMEGDAVW